MRTLACLGLLLALTAGLGAEPEFRFTSDWTSGHVDLWQEHLGHLQGQPAKGLEIGVFEGRSSLWFLANFLDHPDSRLTCVDVFYQPWEKRFDHNIALAGVRARVQKEKGFSQDVLRRLPLASYDFVYVDACHMPACALNDACLSWLLLKPGGIMIFDDYGYVHPKHGDADELVPRPAVDLFLKVMGKRLELLHRDYQVIVRKLVDS